jgi:hypothetical protein
MAALNRIVERLRRSQEREFWNKSPTSSLRSSLASVISDASSVMPDLEVMSWKDLVSRSDTDSQMETASQAEAASRMGSMSHADLVLQSPGEAIVDLSRLCEGCKHPVVDEDDECFTLFK